MSLRSATQVFKVVLPIGIWFLAPACPNKNPVNLPAAETPILETILDPARMTIAPYHAAGIFEMQPGTSLELRLRAAWPTDIQVKVENQLLPEVHDTASHPELAASGFFRISETRVIHSADPRLFWRVLVVLPAAKVSSNVAISVIDVSRNSSFTGPQKEAPPLQILVFRTPVTVTKPSAVFFDPNNADTKHVKTTTSAKDAGFMADDVTLAGWLVKAEPNYDEDFHYGLWLDNDFIERNYSASTLPFATLTMPGRWYTYVDNLAHPKVPLTLTGGKPPNAGMFILPGLDILNVELNIWHKSRHGNQLPSGWVGDSDPATHPDVVWPFNPMNPFGTTANEPDLQEGNYVILTGALVEDTAHLHFDPASAVPDDWRHDCWNNHYTGQGGWLEIHPVDSIRRVNPPAVRKDVKLIQLCDDGSGHTPTGVDQYLDPIPVTPPTDYSVPRFVELIDDRFTDMSTLSEHLIEISPYAPGRVHTRVTLRPGSNGHFKAVYLLWWEESNTKRPAPVPMPAGHPAPQEPPVCKTKPSLPQCDDLTRDKT